MRKLGLVLVLLFSFLPVPSFAAEIDTKTMEQELEKLETEAVDDAAEELDAKIGFSKLLEEVLLGEFDFTFSGWKEKLTEAAFGEFRLQGKLLMQLIIVVLLSAILKQLSDSFQGKSVGEMGFYLCYMVLVVVILDAFHGISDAVTYL